MLLLFLCFDKCCFKKRASAGRGSRAGRFCCLVVSELHVCLAAGASPERFLPTTQGDAPESERWSSSFILLEVAAGWCSLLGERAHASSL